MGDDMKNEKLIVFGKRLKELRIAAKRTQPEMGELLNCTKSNYQKIEYGEINIPITSLMILADYFGVSADYLLGREQKEPAASENT